MNKDEVIEMIPQSNDLLNEQERNNLLKLITVVDSVYPILCEELLSTNNQRTQGYILAILGKSKESKEPILKYIREYMIRHKEDDPQPDSIFTAIKTLGEIGIGEDIDLLSHFLNIGFDSSRFVAAQSIEQIRTRELAKERDSKRLDRNSKKGVIEYSAIDTPINPTTKKDQKSQSSLKKNAAKWKSLFIVFIGVLGFSFIGTYWLWRKKKSLHGFR
jgi:hypothetical protein